MPRREGETQNEQSNNACRNPRQFFTPFFGGFAVNFVKENIEEALHY